MTSNQDLLSVTAFFSALLHAIVILGISFKLPDIASVDNTDNTLDVVLINNPNNTPPTDASTISTKDSLGGGKDDQQASTPLPYKAVNNSPIDSIKMTAEQQRTTSLTPDQLITADQSTLQVKRNKPVETKLKAEQPLIGKKKITTKSKRQLERERLIAKISQNWEDYQKRPNKVYLGPETKMHEAAQYLINWHKKVVTVGNANYPTQARVQKLTGTLILTVEINRNGTIASIIINSPSPHKILNDSAKRFVRDASPFNSFPDEIDSKTDILVITRAFIFLGSNRITTSDASAIR